MVVLMVHDQHLDGADRGLISKKYEMRDSYFSSNVLSDFMMRAASHRMQESPDLLQGMKKVHEIYTNPQTVVSPTIGRQAIV